MAKRQGPYCDGKLHGRDGTCTLPAGWGTDHRGTGKCRKHLGNSPTVAKAAERERVEHEARRALEGITEFEAVADPVARLQLLAGRAERFMEVLGERVAELRGVRYSTKAGEQLRAEVAVYERAMTSTGRLLVDLAKLNLDERLVRISEAQGRLMTQVLLGALDDAGLSAEAQKAVRPAIARRLELAAAGERQRELRAG
jgi:hypothetical protein